MPCSVSFLHLLLFVLLLLRPAAGSRHVIPLPADLRPSSLAWDPHGQHFIVGSGSRPIVSSVSDAGVVHTLIPSGPGVPTSVAAVAVDSSRRRLIAAFSSPPTVAAYDLRSPAPHPLLFSSPLSDPAASVSATAVDPATGAAFVTTSSGQVYTVDLEGGVSILAQVSGGIAGAAHFSRGFLLVIERETGELFKVDAEDGARRRVLISSPDEAAVAAVAVRSDGGAVVAAGEKARWVTSGDGWGEAAVYDEFRVGAREKIAGAAVRDGRRAYVLVAAAEEAEGRIEEVEWAKEGEGEMVWALVMVGLGLAYFMYWRLQMGKLISGINKKTV